MTHVNKGDFLRDVFNSWKEVPDDWTFGKMIKNAATIAYGAEVDLTTVSDERLASGIRALQKDPFEDDPSMIVDPFARAWEREHGVGG